MRDRLRRIVPGSRVSRAGGVAPGAARSLVEGLESRVHLHAGHEHGTGLLGEYYNNANFTDLKLTRVDPLLNFSWDTGSPAPTISPDTFSVRWTGQLEA